MKKVFLYISIGIILLSIPVTVFLVSRNQEIRKRAAPASTLSLSPSTITKKAGETFTLEVKLDTGDNQVMTVQLAIIYDPAKLTTEDITNGPMAPTIRVSGKANPNGIASITVGARDNATPITGAGTIAKLTLRALSASAAPATIKFSPHPDTQANALNETSNVIIGLTGANVVILNADGSQATTNSVPAALNPENNATQSGTQATQSALLTPTPTVIQASTTDSQASSSALLIESPELNEDVATQVPEIRGKGVPGSTITVIIHSDPITETVTVDANGNWVYTPSSPLSPGEHSVEAMYTDPTTGQTQTQTITFTVAAGESAPEESTGTAIPVSGNVQTTVLLMILGTLFLATGIVLPVFVR
jgi:hypothetical protein